jgi:four helix bundle protein
MRAPIKSYEDLEVWQLGIALTLRAYDIVGRLPASERFELSSQIRRCVVSIPANVAEGHARRGQTKAYLNHVFIALGSLAEWGTYLVIAERRQFISADTSDQDKREADRLGQMLHALTRSLEYRVERSRLGLALAGLGLGTAVHALLVLR